MVCLLLCFGCWERKYAIINSRYPTILLITTEGKGTIGCFVNGCLWVRDGHKSTVQCNYYSWNDDVYLYGTLAIKAYCDIDDSYITMTLHNRVFNTGKYLLYNSSNDDDVVLFAAQFFYLNYSMDSNNYVNISRLDTINRIVSGTFQFKAMNRDNNSDTVKVTGGRIDLKY